MNLVLFSKFIILLNKNFVTLNLERMYKVAILRKKHFNSAHRINRSLLTVEENKTIFGKCHNPNFHAHNYELAVNILNTKDVAVFTETRHLGVSPRGIKDDSASTVTSLFGGKFKEAQTQTKFRDYLNTKI